jgi:hypothetical protein
MNNLLVLSMVVTGYSVEVPDLASNDHVNARFDACVANTVKLIS